MFDLALVNDYFETHLDQAFWRALPEGQQAAAIRMAELDVGAALGIEALDETNIFQYCAVCEQALHLAHVHEVKKEEKVEPRLVAEDIEGIGSRRYEYPAEPEATAPTHSWSERAMAFLARAGRTNNGRFGRG